MRSSQTSKKKVKKVVRKARIVLARWVKVSRLS
jgi:hypothetical protein